MNTVSEDIKDLLVNNGIGIYAAVTGWGIYRGIEPEQPNTTITVYDIGGRTPLYDMGINSAEPMKTLTVGIRVRGTTYDSAYSKINEIVNLLDDHARWKVGTVKYESVLKLMEPFFLKRDKNKRYIWSCDFMVTRV